ncbi:MAG: acyl-CoA dehydrogenase C-terminal domain-containing protein, partial [Xanthomonadales bacterium]|nr:acyl-CoA dehydrogenase C-terminal domain-containing protein [Xanthomonadales bacterium]
AMQIYGGHGYIAEWGMEQLARDARITTIYEGTTGIQALDLLGRKTLQSQGAGLKLFLTEVADFCAANAGNADVAEFIPVLTQLAQQWQELTLHVGKASMANPDELGAAAVDYLFYSGYVSLAYFSARLVAAARPQGDAFLKNKLDTARFYFTRILPRAASHAAAIRAGAATLMAMDDEAFG